MDRRVRKLSFTGSTHVGKILLAEASRRVINTSMELGGNAPFLVLGDADVPTAVEGALVAKMRNAGEACTAANRFYVHGSVADEFGRQLADRMRRMTVGHGLTPGVEVGPLINASSRDGVAELVAASVDGNARVLTGGSIPDQKGYFYTPTVLGDVAPDDAILEEEIFGPVAPIVPFDDLDDAIGMANNTEMGLIAYVYGGDQARAMAVAEALEAGMVAVNRGLLSDPAAPFGGIKQSGIGREGGFHGIYEYLEAKYIGTSW
jgi:succinate-semialdehyde dehydrogenase/glutarate-semialdehyde dehydrogenase